MSDRRQRRIAARKAQILEAAAQVIAEKGFHNASIRDIAAAADVADGTIYNYFEDKNALLMAIIDQLSEMEQAPISVEGDFKQTVIERIRAAHQSYDMVTAVLPEILGNPDLRDAYYARFIQPVVAALETQLAERVDPDRIEPTARLLMCTVVGLQVLLILGDPALHDSWEHPDQLAEVWSDFLKFGLGVQ